LFCYYLIVNYGKAYKRLVLENKGKMFRKTTATLLLLAALGLGSGSEMGCAVINGFSPIKSIPMCEVKVGCLM